MKNAILSLVLSGVLAGATAQAATVTGSVADATGAARTGTITFTPLSNPTVSGGVIFDSTPTSITLTNGAFVVTLQQGDYAVKVGRDSFDIAVPNNENIYSIQELVTTELTYTYTAVPGVVAAAELITATTATAGAVKIYTLDLNPVVYLTSDVDTLLAAKADLTNTVSVVTDDADPAETQADAEIFHINSVSGAVYMWDGDSWVTVRSADAVATPTFSPATGTTFLSTQDVTIACSTAGASIYYTVDGSTPDTNDTIYSSAFTLTNTTTVKAKAFLTGLDDSSTGTATYTELFPVYWGKSASASLDEAGIIALASTNKTSAAGSYTYTTDSGYSYFATPASWSTPTSLKIGAVDVTLLTTSPFDTAFGSLYCDLVDVGGVSYRVFRTYNSTSSGWIMIVE